jgi:hypothetical protein
MGEELGLCSLLLHGLQGTERGVMMATLSLVTTVFISKAEAFGLFTDTLGLPWILDDPTDVTVALPDGVVMGIEVPKFGEDLPITLDLEHADPDVLSRVAEDFARRLESVLGWATYALPLRA